ncbi:hypothetical protein LOTGIDRAFT_141510, partial [Lottia gigantea]
EEKPKQEAPKFIVSLETVEIKEGEKAKFYCKATGVPKPELIWYKNDKIISEDDKHFTIEFGEDTDSTLIIVDVHPQDDGTYSCEAKNPVGTDKCKAELFVEGNYHLLCPIS